ncbi:NIPSNAP family protein [Tundrisphaera lichenicola]|uniref:NIPSNAP family protein n=1 Tax=Tundrisphaera lichenicola TaxID=2029860 RepID=UPI003EBDAF83
MFRSAVTFGLLALLAAPSFAEEKSGQECSPGKDRVFEMRTYYTHEGRLPALNKRFREHTTELFKKHGMENIGYWTPAEEKDGKNEKLVYLLAYPSMEAREKSWKAFGADPEWHKARDASEADGKIVKKVESVFLNPTDYSPIK